MKLEIINGRSHWVLTEEDKVALKAYGTSRSIDYFKGLFGQVRKLYSDNGWTLYYFHVRPNNTSDYVVVEDKHLQDVLEQNLERVSTIEFCLKDHSLDFIHWISKHESIPQVVSDLIINFQNTFKTTPIEIKPVVYSKMYIAVLETVPDHMVPVLVAHSVLGAHLQFEKDEEDSYQLEDCVYHQWLHNSFRKCVVKVNQKEFDRITRDLPVYLGHENTTLSGIKSCAVIKPVQSNAVPNVLKFAKLWRPDVKIHTEH